MNYNRHCLLLLGFLAIAVASADFDQPQANQPQPPILPSRWTAVGQLAQGGYPSNDTYLIFYDWNAQMQRVNQFISGTADTHTFLINYGTQMLYMYITRNGKVKSCVTSPYYQSMPPPNMFASASFVGPAKIHGQDCNGWKLDTSWTGNMHIWVTSDNNTPVRIASYGSRFDLSEFKTGSFDPNVFSVPDACKGW